MSGGMAAHIDKTNKRSASTTRWRYVTKIAEDPAPQASTGRRRRRWAHLSHRDPKSRLTITIVYRGGAEGWYHVEARGSDGAFPGVLSLHDVMREINDGSRYRRE